jgi:CRISPR/Cas system-associated exonuclease Cas4 (RecB family)
MAEAGLLSRPAPGSIVFIYELKMDQAYKEFSVDYNPDLISDVIENLELIAEAMKTGIAPPCTQSEKGCKLCALAEKAGTDE